MRQIELIDFGPVERASIELGDLTVLVGPQASGKSVVLQTLKAVRDMDAIVDVLKRHGYHWQAEPHGLFELIYGEGMGTLVSSDSRIHIDDAEWDLSRAAAEAWSKTSRGSSRMFYVPAQRVLTLQEGWPTPFGGFPVGAPYVVKQFSEDVRVQLEALSSDTLFPVSGRFKAELREFVDRTVFHGATVRVDSSRLRKRVEIQVSPDARLPFLSWSAGQREFIPLMLGLYWLMPTQGSGRRRPLEWAVIEEPEMGLHPAAVSAVALLVLDLLKRGYRVVLSTHSPHLLELIWALGALRPALAYDPDHLARLFQLTSTPGLRQIASSLVDKEFRVFYLNGGLAKDISSLDPASEDPDVSGWGGLTDFAEHAGELVASTFLL